MQARLLWISGRVQGVGYRYWASGEARKLGLVGWVRNLPDGRVEALIQGEVQAIEAMIEGCRSGPVFAKVSAVDWEERPVSNSLSDFTQRR